jgi:DNA-binding winged helix-turn-helix (wHTH) protein/tetratricopeptide (TPR) repeat protein
VSRLITFPPFQVDAANERLWRDADPIPLRPKSFALLRYLAERPGQLVTKDELLDAVWPETHVTDVVLKVCINELRQVLGDTAKAPRFIATVYRRGYRFVAQAAEPDAEASTTPPTILVGRDAEIARLEQSLEQATRGQRQVVFVSGEAGVGKTTLIAAFLERAATRAGARRPWIARGQCVAQYGAAEPFLPFLEGLGRLCRSGDGAPLVARLRELAPEWLLQLPGVVGASERQALQRRVQMSGADRMLRVMADALEALGAERPLLVVLEDLHWSDHATLDLLAHVAGRTDPARLLVLGSYRPADAIVHEHPIRALRRELQVHRRASELSLGLLTPDMATTFLEARFPGATLPAGLAAWLYRRTDGNPLFMASVVDELAAQGLVADVAGRRTPQPGFERVGVPENLRMLIEHQVERLSAAERNVLDAASAVGTEFSAGSVAAALEADTAEVEACCAGLAERSHMLRPLGRQEWPDGTVSSRYGFAHAVHREELYGRLPASRRAQLHRRVAERLVRAYGEDAIEVAAELALRFEESGDRRRAVVALRRVAEHAVTAGAHRDALASLSHAFALLAAVPEGRERDEQELALHHVRGAALMRASGFAHPDVRDAYEHAHALSIRLGDEATALVALAGRWSFHFFRRETRPMLDIAEQLTVLADRTPLPLLVLVARTLMGITRTVLGELESARACLEEALATGEQVRPLVLIDLRAAALSAQSIVLLLLGYPDQARRHLDEALERARSTGGLFELAIAHAYACEVSYYLGDAAGVQRFAEDGERLAVSHGFRVLVTIFRVARSWALAVRGGEAGLLAEMETQLAEYKALGSEAARPFLLGVLADALSRAGRYDEALARLREGEVLAEQTGDRRDVAELSRLLGERALAAEARRRRRAGPPDDAVREAERYFRRAVEVARGQQARWVELRALTSLARLPLSSGDRLVNGDALAHALGCVSEGADTPTVLSAHAALARLGRQSHS